MSREKQKLPLNHMCGLDYQKITVRAYTLMYMNVDPNLADNTSNGEHETNTHKYITIHKVRAPCIFQAQRQQNDHAARLGHIQAITGSVVRQLKYIFVCVILFLFGFSVSVQAYVCVRVCDGIGLYFR